ncbi:TPA: monooxygenase PumA, partial [Pseudomonas aeruginosa]|nr:monooxygenase PumA [Pseudomonas aeruginosa]
AREDAQGPLSAGVWRLGAKSVRFETFLVDAEGC